MTLPTEATDEVTTNLVVRYDDVVVELAPGAVLHVGRDDGADLSIADPNVSRQHARFYYSHGWRVADEGSTNGTHLDGVRIEDAALPVLAQVGLGLPGASPVLTVETADGTGNTLGLGPGAATVLKGEAPQPFRAAPAPAPLAAGTPVVTIGKAPDNDVVLDDINVSRHHARVVLKNDGFLVEDLNSLNGTYLNAVPVQRAFMQDGDRLTIGNADFVAVGPRLVPMHEAGSSGGGLRVDGLDFTLGSGKRLISGVDLTADRGTLTAVIGPSGAGKSTLAGLLAGVTTPTSGHVSFDGFDLQRDYRAVKTRVGLVPQDDVVHRQLRLRTALRYAAELRLPSRLPVSAKRAQVAKTVAQLGLEQHASTRIGRLSGGQRKRASVALELLTEPSLLLLDEPTSGLDPALDRQVMRTLRDLADGERTVVVVTHSVAYLDLCDQVLVLAPGGLPAYLGAPGGIERHFGTADWGDVFAIVADDPATAAARWAARRRTRPSAPATPPAGRRGAVHGSGWLRQLGTVAVRQVNVMVSDRGYLAFLLALPVLLGLLPFVVPGSAGLTAVPANQPAHAAEPTFVLALLVIGATFMGTSMSIRDLVGERAIFLRERAVGLFPSAYLVAKLLVFGLFSLLTSAIMTLVVPLVKHAPASGVLGFGPPLFQLWLPLALTTWVSAILGLAVSAFVSSNDQVMPVLILLLMVQLVLNGGLIPVLGSDLLNGLSKLIPARWGFAAAASGVDLQALLAPGHLHGTPPAQLDPIWAARKRQWTIDMGVLALFGGLFAATAAVRLRARR